MNNHFGYSRIFKNARFAVEEGNGGNGPDGIDIDVSGGGSGSENNEPDNKDGSETMNKYKELLAKANADIERYKNSISKLNKEKSELTKKNRDMMGADQLEKEAREEQQKRIAEMEKEIRTNKYSKRSIALGMTETEADDFAASLPEFEDADKFFSTLGNFIKAKEKAAADKAIQDLLKTRPDIQAGNGDSDKEDPAMAFAKRSVAMNKGNNFGKVNDDIIKYYTGR